MYSSFHLEVILKYGGNVKRIKTIIGELQYQIDQEQVVLIVLV